MISPGAYSTAWCSFSRAWEFPSWTGPAQDSEPLECWSCLPWCLLTCTGGPWWLWPDSWSASLRVKFGMSCRLGPAEASQDIAKDTWLSHRAWQLGPADRISYVPLRPFQPSEFDMSIAWAMWSQTLWAGFVSFWPHFSRLWIQAWPMLTPAFWSGASCHVQHFDVSTVRMLVVDMTSIGYWRDAKVEPLS